MTRLQKLALAAAAVTYLVVVIGCRHARHGLGHGLRPDWPLCHGVLPALSDGPAWIEWWHRCFALLLGVLVTAVAAVALLRTASSAPWWGSRWRRSCWPSSRRGSASRPWPPATRRPR